MTQPFAVSLIETLLRTPFIGKLEFVLNDSLVSRARNTIAARFLASEYQWLLFLDNDLEFRPEHIARIWLHAVKHERRIVGGLYAMKKIAPHFVANFLDGEKPDENGAARVAEIGTGFMCVHRSVFELMRDRMPEIAYTTDINATNPNATEWDFFAVGPYRYRDSGLVRYLSEDWMFCQRARDLGVDVWADTHIQLSHFGNLLYPPPVKDLVAAVKVVRRMGHPAMPAELI